MPAEITMPQLSDTMTEGTLIKWHKREGEKVREGEEIADIETDKATMPMESPASGTLAAIAISEGQKVPVGAVLGLIAVGSEKPQDVKGQVASKGSAKTQSPESVPQAAGASVVESSPRPAVRRVPPPSASAGTGVGSAQVSGGRSSNGGAATLEAASRGEMHEPDDVGHGATRGTPVPVPPIPSRGNGQERIFASPLARRIAADKGIDLGQLKGTGPGGRIVQSDVLSYQPVSKSVAAAKPAGPPPVGNGQTRVRELTKMRLTIAKRLQQSMQTLPHFYETVDIDVEELSGLRVRINEQLKSENIKLSLGDMIAKAVASALQRHPIVNSTFDGEKITEHGDVNLGMAVALDNGLIVPVLRGIDRMGLREIRQRSADLIERARAQRLKQDELSGATFTVSNLGSFGVREFTAIINPPEVGILAIGAAAKRAVVRNDQIVARTMLTVTLSSDHRVVDGATAAQFLQTLRGCLEEPGLMLL